MNLFGEPSDNNDPDVIQYRYLLREARLCRKQAIRARAKADFEEARAWEAKADRREADASLVIGRLLKSNPDVADRLISESNSI